MNKTTASVFFNRIKRVCLLDATVYQEARYAFLPAFLIVFLVALAHGAGGIIRARINSWDAQESFIFAVQGELVFWLVQSFVYYMVARWVLNRRVGVIEILSSVGFAIFPGILVLLAAPLQWWGLSIPLLILLAFVRLVTCTLALQQLFKINLAGAFLLVVVGSGIGFLSLGIVIRITEAIVK